VVEFYIMMINDENIGFEPIDVPPRWREKVIEAIKSRNGADEKSALI